MRYACEGPASGLQGIRLAVPARGMTEMGVHSRYKGRWGASLFNLDHFPLVWEVARMLVLTYLVELGEQAHDKTG